jgi:thiosulfate dehydrogenase (quinone) large subunit
MDTDRLTARVDLFSARWVPSVLRWTAALLWLANVNWKIPPNFGRSDEACRQLCAFVQMGVESPVAPGSGWMFEQVVGPNLAAFGWVVLLTEFALAVLLIAGRYLRLASVLGVAMSLGIGLAVANDPREWYWSYVLMIVLHLGVLTTTRTERGQTAGTMAVVTVAYGLLVAIANLRAGFTGGGDWHLLARDNPNVPADWGVATFPGSIALGLLIALIGAVGWFAHRRFDGTTRRWVGWGAVAAAGLLVLTYRAGELGVGLGSVPGNAAVVGALGLALAVAPPPGGADGRASRAS